jgi:hypothetical protein
MEFNSEQKRQLHQYVEDSNLDDLLHFIHSIQKNIKTEDDVLRELNEYNAYYVDDFITDFIHIYDENESKYSHEKMMFALKYKSDVVWWIDHEGISVFKSIFENNDDIAFDYILQNTKYGKHLKLLDFFYNNGPISLSKYALIHCTSINLLEKVLEACIKQNVCTIKQIKEEVETTTLNLYVDKSKLYDLLYQIEKRLNLM